MAFDIKRFGGNVGGGFAPRVFSYTTPDGVADVTANGYWDELGGTLQVGDIIVAVLLEDGATVARVLVVNLSTLVDSKTALITAFVGDVRADDTAGFQGANFGGNIGAGSESRLFTYRNNANTLAEIAGADYFNEIASAFLPGDTIIAVASDGASYVRVVDSVDGVVTAELITFAI